ncbi:MAG: TIR domain-containing protein [Cyanobacteria bacterium P01_H01_bin.153]
MSTFKDVFISYGRADSKALASQLSKRLSAMGVSVWFDFDDIPLATDFQERIDNGIARAHNFLYIISPSSVNSPYCDKELQLALKYGKQIIPLMHVEEISAQTWKRRNLQGTKAEWQAFKAAGKHRSFENLNETARKLNWVTFRPGDDVKTWLQNLVALFHQEQDYVQHHTQLLTQALDWARHHRQTRYLLVGTERQEAETWLQSRLTDEALPYPSPVHCEFITESIKNANNLMTQVFLCHSYNDQDSAEQIRQSLLRRGITVWNYRTDIQTSQDYTNAIAQGIEEADNIIFMLSPHSANSSYCQHELKQALSLHKRVIPVLAAPVEPEQVPASLRSLQYIDLTDNAEGIDDTSDDAERLKRLNYQSDESELLKLLDGDAAYHAEHKTWLTQALKWERQQHEPAMLLRGYNLHQAENWLKVARNHSYPPTELQAEFIAASLRQPPSMSSDVFISYSRVDSDFARRLNEALQVQGKRTWFDQESLAKGTDFQQEIYRGIESSDVFLFVLSPQSISSPYCADEVEYADRLHKRIVTVLHRPIDTDDLHPVLADIQWLDFRDHDGDFQTNFQHLLRTLDTDRAHLAAHTRLLGRALEWDRSSRDESLLLRGKDLDTAEQWLKENAAIEPKPTGLQQEYVRAGRARENAQAAAAKKLRRGALIGGVAATAGILIATIAGGFAYQVRQQRKLAQTVNRLELAGVTAYRRLDFDQVGALMKAIKAGRELETVATKVKSENVSDYPATNPLLALQQIKQAAIEVPNRLLAGHEDVVEDASFSPDGQQVVTTSADRTARLWNLETGESTVLEGHQDEVWDVSFSPDSQQVVTASKDGTARLWNLATEESTVLEGHQDWVNRARFSPDGQQVVTASSDGTARLWNLETKESTVLEGHQDEIWDARFSPDGQQVVTGSRDGTARLWNLATGESTVLGGHQDDVYGASFSPDGQQVVTTSWRGAARLWNLETGEFTVLEGHGSETYRASFSPNGQQVMTASWDKTVRMWDLQGRQLAIFEGEAGALSPDGQQVAAVKDGKVQVYDVATLPELLDWGCEWLHSYLEYGPATDSDRAACNLPPRPEALFEAALEPIADAVSVSWPQL